MSTDTIIPRETSSAWYDAVLRISEALCTCCEPEELAKSLANELDQFLDFDHLYLAVLKENSKEVEYRVCGKGNVPSPDLPMEELPVWETISSPGSVRAVY